MATEVKPAKVYKDIRRSSIINQMMRGIEPGRKAPGKRVAVPEVQEAFMQRYKEVIDWVYENLPMKISAAVYGVVGKCALWYGREKIQGLCRAIKNYEFNGPKDPAYALQQWLLRNVTRDTAFIYARAVTACRAYCTGRQMEPGHIRASKTDIFDWDPTYTVMMRDNKAQFGPKFTKKKWDGQTAVQVPEEAPTNGTKSKATKKIKREKPKPQTGRKVVTQRRRWLNVGLTDILAAGLLTAPLKLHRAYLGRDFEATLLPNGCIEFQGVSYKGISTSAEFARKEITGRRMHTNGWEFWQFDDTDGQRKSLLKVREKLIAIKSAVPKITTMTMTDNGDTTAPAPPKQPHRSFYGTGKNFNLRQPPPSAPTESPTERLWRTLVRVDEVVFDEQACYVIVPAWNSQERVKLVFKDIPPKIMSILWPGKRLHARVNTGAEQASDLRFHSWETQ